MIMRNRSECPEPMCETSEPGERLVSRKEILPISLEIGRRLLDVFGYQRIRTLVFRLKTNSHELRSIINGEKLPSTELLIGIQRATGVSIDWLLTGEGPQYILRPQPLQLPRESMSLAVINVHRETNKREPVSYAN